MINKKEKDGVIRLEAKEDFTVQNAPKLQEKLGKLLEKIDGNSRVVLDLTRTKVIDSIGIKLVVGLFKTCQQKDLAFSVEASSVSIVKVLKLCKMDQLMEINEVQLNG